MRPTEWDATRTHRIRLGLGPRLQEGSQMLEGQTSSETLAFIYAANIPRRPLVLDWQDNALRPIGKAELVDFQQLAQLPTTDE